MSAPKSIMMDETRVSEGKIIAEAGLTNISFPDLRHWDELFEAMPLGDEDRALQIINEYLDFLKKMEHQCFLIQILAKAIQSNAMLIVQKLLLITPLRKLEKDFTSQTKFLPLVFALQYNASQQMLFLLQMAGANKKASYAPDQDASDGIKKMLGEADLELPTTNASVVPTFPALPDYDPFWESSHEKTSQFDIEKNNASAQDLALDLDLLGLSLPAQDNVPLIFSTMGRSTPECFGTEGPAENHPQQPEEHIPGLPFLSPIHLVQAHVDPIYAAFLSPIPRSPSHPTRAGVFGIWS